MNKLNNLLQNFDYILTIISTIKYLKTEKLLEIHVLFLLQIKSENIKIANFCANIIHFYYLRYFKLNNINSFFFRKLRYSKLSTIFQIFHSNFCLFLAFRIKFQKTFYEYINTLYRISIWLSKEMGFRWQYRFWDRKSRSTRLDLMKSFEKLMKVFHCGTPIRIL